jgi:enoyl-CoA hydratase/carnithine racemase
VHGVAFGGGFQICLGADMRFIAPDAQLSVMEIKWGLVPDMAGVVLMRRPVRDDVTRELIYSGRIFNGQEALGLGLTTGLRSPRGEALKFAKEVAGKSPDAIRAAKRLIALAAEDDQRAIPLAETDRTDEADWITQSSRGGTGEFGEARAPVRRLTRCRLKCSEKLWSFRVRIAFAVLAY